MDYTQRLIVAAGIVVLASGCGGKPPAETPEPMPEAPAPVATAPMPAPPPPPAEPEPDMDGWRRTLEEQIHFELDKYELSPEARMSMAAKVEVLRSSPSVTLRIDGHADERGSDEYNLVLSKRRAAEAKRYLVQQGIDSGRVETEGYGEEQPLDPGNNESAWAMNRRAGFQVMSGSVSQR